LPSDIELLDLLRASADEVFATMVAGYVAAYRPISGRDVAEDAKLERLELSLGTMVEFDGAASGAVVLRCDAVGAHDLALGLLRLEQGATLSITEVEDALGECANMVTGLLKTRALDPRGIFQLGTPRKPDATARFGTKPMGELLYRLSRGALSLEVWRSARAPEV
jgi:hypothetical protein